MAGKRQVNIVLDKLNTSQLKAVTAPVGPLVIVAGAGSGKTRVITYRIAYLIASSAATPAQILAVTFTNKAAGEMADRAADLVGGVPRPLVSTFHSFCARLLRAEGARARAGKNFIIFDQQDSYAAVKRIIRDLELPEEQFNYRAVAHAIDRAKNDLLRPGDLSTSGYYEATIAGIYAAYQDFLVDNNAYDFGDLIVETVALLKNDSVVREKYASTYRHILVDEYQDTNLAQYELIKSLGEEHKSVCVVGDPDQSIYGWRGASVVNFKRFLEDFPDAKVLNLERNYRSHEGILCVANGLIKYNTRSHLDKELWSDRGREIKPVLLSNIDERHEALRVLYAVEELRANYGLSYSDFAVLYRTNAQSRVFEDVFGSAKIPYKVVGGVRFYERKEVKDVLAYLRAAHNTADSVSFERIVNTPPRGIGKKSLEALMAGRRGRSLQDTAADATVRNELPQKAAKGLADLLDLMGEIRAAEEDGRPVSEMLGLIAKKSGYLRWLEEDRDVTSSFRADNVNELITAAAEFEEYDPDGGVEAFLDAVSLVQDADELDNGEVVSFMTLHTAKGLEFPAVFIVGMEEYLLPHANSMGDEDELEEERRLCYVGVTRAMDILYLSYAQTRALRGVTEARLPSRFLREIPEDLLDRVDALDPEAVLRHEPWGRG
jgi:DNA helicase-2/ATP-dependent DNA helicase PcrA